MNAVKNDWLKPSSLVIKSKLYESIHELNVDLMLVCLHNMNLLEIWVPLIVLDKNVRYAILEHFLLFGKIDI